MTICDSDDYADKAKDVHKLLLSDLFFTMQQRRKTPDVAEYHQLTARIASLSRRLAEARRILRLLGIPTR